MVKQDSCYSICFSGSNSSGSSSSSAGSGNVRHSSSNISRTISRSKSIVLYRFLSTISNVAIQLKNVKVKNKIGKNQEKITLNASFKKN